MKENLHSLKVQSWIWITAFILSNFRGTVIWDIIRQGFQVAALPWIEVSVWAVLLMGAMFVMSRDRLIADYLVLWRQNWILAVFIFIAFLSLFWTVSFSASLYRSAALLSSSLVGAYIGTRYSIRDLLDFLFRFGTILLIVCLALALFLPIMGVMGWEPYNGAWRGVFWHKNQFGSLAALFSLVFLVSGLSELGKTDGKPALYFVFYLFSLVLIYFSKSVAGYFLCLVLSFSTVLAYFWLKFLNRLTATHYYIVLGFGILTALLLLLNLDFVFGLFNRDTSLTGRLPLWEHLIRDVFVKSPWVGHGFGALWSMSSFRIATQKVVGWGFPVAIGDNGFLDILLHVGLIGFIPFLGVLITLFVRSSKFAFQHLSIASFFPLLLAIFAVLANVSFSLFLETETFVWLVMVASLFMVTKTPQPT